MAMNTVALKKLISERKCNIGQLLKQEKDLLAMLELVEKMELACRNLPACVGADFMFEGIIPSIFTVNNQEVKTALIELAKRLLPLLPITILNAKQIHTFKMQMKQKYINALEELRVSQNPLWHKIWILLIRYLGKHLHNDVQLANCMLRMIENAFRSPHDRIVSYDCWKVLIDNYNLDELYISNPKHIKLLLIPMKANLSKSDKFVIKKFEIWTYLIKVLNQNAATYLESFLIFCFGKLVENSIAFNNFPTSNRGVNSILLGQDATEVLQEILGHAGHGRENCSHISTKYNFDKPVVIYSNFATISNEITNAVFACCLLLKNWAEDRTRIDVVKCLWGSLIHILENQDQTTKSKIVEKIAIFLIDVVQGIDSQKLQFFDGLLDCICSICGNSNLLVTFLSELSNTWMKADKCFLKSFVKVVQHLISSAANSTDRHQYFLKLCAIFSQPRLNKNIDFWCHVWLESAKVLLTICENLTKNDKEFVNGDVLTFLMWIVIYLHFTSPTLEKEIFAMFSSIYKSISLLSSECEDRVKGKMESIVATNPAIGVNVSKIKQHVFAKDCHKDYTLTEFLPKTSPLLTILPQATTSSTPTIITVKRKGSQLKNLSTPKPTKKSANIVPRLFKEPSPKNENSADFVVIDTQYTFDRSKLSEHQRDALKSRNRGIPALYQDLTQDSQNSCLSQDFNLETNETKTKENGTDQKKTENNLVDFLVQNALSENGSVKVEESEVEHCEVKVEEGDVKLEESEIKMETEGGGFSFGSLFSEAVEKLNVNNEQQQLKKHKQAQKKPPTQRKRGKQKQKNNILQTSKQTQPVSEVENTDSTDNKQPTPPQNTPKTVNIEEKRRIRTQKELVRLRMDVKGAETFLTQKRTRKSLQDDQKFIYLQPKKRTSPSTPKKTTCAVAAESPKSRADSGVKKQCNLLNFLIPAAESENQVIESSQESIIDVLPLSKTDDSLTESEKINCKKETETCNPDENIDVPQVLKLDLPTAKIADSDREACSQDTESPSFSSDLPSSPVTTETPTRTSELLLNTSDISPIRNAGNSPTRTPDESPDRAAVNAPTAPEEVIENETSQEEEAATYLKTSNLRSAKLLSLISGNKMAMKYRPRTRTAPPRLNAVSMASPKTDRIKRMMASLGKKKTNDKEVGKGEENATAVIDVENLLMFEREVPSPLAVPAGGSILKRKKPDSYDENSPCPKRKRVNFSDPPITCQKIIIQDENARTTNKTKAKPVAEVETQPPSEDEKSPIKIEDDSEDCKLESVEASPENDKCKMETEGTIELPNADLEIKNESIKDEADEIELQEVQNAVLDMEVERAVIEMDQVKYENEEQDQEGSDNQVTEQMNTYISSTNTLNDDNAENIAEDSTETISNSSETDKENAAKEEVSSSADLLRQSEGASPFKVDCETLKTDETHENDISKHRPTFLECMDGVLWHLKNIDTTKEENLIMIEQSYKRFNRALPSSIKENIKDSFCSLLNSLYN